MKKMNDLEKVDGISNSIAKLLKEELKIETPNDLKGKDCEDIYKKFKKLKLENKISYQVSKKSIQTWIDNANKDDYKYYHTVQIYYSLMERNFNKILRVILFKYLIVEKTEVPDEISFTISKDDGNLFKAIFDDMKEVRNNNKIISNWIKNNKKRKYELWDKYEQEFKKGLSLEEFIEFYGKDDDDRTCEYCGIKESEIDSLITAGKIKTKRLYSRGRSLEVDKKDPNGDYTKDNIVLSCYWCNNAKTDEFTYDEFKRIGIMNRIIWENRIKGTDWSSEMYDKLKNKIEVLDFELKETNKKH